MFKKFKNFYILNKIGDTKLEKRAIDNIKNFMPMERRVCNLIIDGKTLKIHKEDYNTTISIFICPDIKNMRESVYNRFIMAILVYFDIATENGIDKTIDKQQVYQILLNNIPVDSVLPKEYLYDNFILNYDKFIKYLNKIDSIVKDIIENYDIAIVSEIVL